MDCLFAREADGSLDDQMAPRMIQFSIGAGWVVEARCGGGNFDYLPYFSLRSKPESGPSPLLAITCDSQTVR